MHPPSIITIYMHSKSVSHHRATATAPSAAASNTSAPGIASRHDDASLLPGLVAPRTSSIPEWPYDVARTEGSM